MQMFPFLKANAIAKTKKDQKFNSSARFQTDELFRRRQQTRAAIINATKEFLKSHFSLGGVKMVQL